MSRCLLFERSSPSIISFMRSRWRSISAFKSSAAASLYLLSRSVTRSLFAEVSFKTFSRISCCILSISAILSCQTIMPPGMPSA